MTVAYPTHSPLSKRKLTPFSLSFTPDTILVLDFRLLRFPPHFFLPTFCLSSTSFHLSSPNPIDPVNQKPRRFLRDVI